MQAGDPIAGLFVIAFVVAIYFVPALVARDRLHRNAQAIFALNLLTGWTLLGWVISLVWALTDNVHPKEPTPIQSGDITSSQGQWWWQK